MRALLALLLLLPSVALGDTWLVSSVGSRHFSGGSHCEFNPGLGLEHGALLGGFYRNSDCKTSFYAGARYVALEWRRWKAGFVGIAVTGYERAITLAPGAMLAYEGERYGVNLVLFPSKDGDLSAGVIGIQWKLRF